MATRSPHIALCLLSISLSSYADNILIHAGTALVTPGQKPLNEVSISIEDGLITQVTKGYQSPSSYQQLIDLKHSFVMPGLWDMHVHLQGEMGPKNDSEALRMSEPLIGMRTIHFGKITLNAGFTTVRDVGSNPQYMYAYRDAVAKGWVEGP